jgi:hypothetical protein
MDVAGALRRVMLRDLVKHGHVYETCDNLYNGAVGL